MHAGPVGDQGGGEGIDSISPNVQTATVKPANRNPGPAASGESQAEQQEGEAITFRAAGASPFQQDHLDDEMSRV